MFPGRLQTVGPEFTAVRLGFSGGLVSPWHKRDTDVCGILKNEGYHPFFRQILALLPLLSTTVYSVYSQLTLISGGRSAIRNLPTRWVAAARCCLPVPWQPVSHSPWWTSQEATGFPWSPSEKRWHHIRPDDWTPNWNQTQRKTNNYLAEGPRYTSNHQLQRGNNHTERYEEVEECRQP